MGSKSVGLRRELGTLFRLSGPLVVVQLGYNAMGAVDVAVVGRLGRVEMGAVGLGHTLYFVLCAAGLGTMFGFDPLVSQAVGAGELGRARNLLWQSVWLAIVASIPVALTLLCVPSLLSRFGIEQEIVRQTARYLGARAPGILPFLLFTGFRGFLQASSRTRAMVVATVAANALNLPLTIALVFGDDGLRSMGLPGVSLPGWGVVGSAYANTVATALQAGILLYAVAKTDSTSIGPVARRPDGRVLLRALTLGLPVGLQTAAEVGVFALAGVLAARLGPLPLAGHQVALTLASLTFTIALGISSATCVRVGHAVGAGDAQAARLSGLAGLWLGFAVMGACGLAFMALPGPIARVLTDQTEVVATTVPLLFIVAVFQVFDGAQVIASGALRGAGRTRAPLVANLLGHYGLGLPVAIALGFGAGMGVRGLWWGLCSGLVAVASLLTWHFFSVSARPLTRVPVS